MKRVLAVLLAVMLLVAAIPAVSVAEEVTSNYCDCDYTRVYRVHTNSGRLYMRTGPGTDYRIITSLSNGKPLKLIRKSGRWYKVKTFGGPTAADCVGCQSCEARCPFEVKIAERMEKAAALFGC